MKTHALQAIHDAFQARGARFIIVGGLAVVAHGYLRATGDADIVIELLPDSIGRAFKALEDLDYRPTLPITAAEFADPEKRRAWAATKNMSVLQFWSDRFPDTPVDIFIDAPFEFDSEWEQAYQQELAPGSGKLRFATLSSLIRMKEKAGRPQDLTDIQHLKWIQEDSES